MPQNAALISVNYVELIYFGYEKHPCVNGKRSEWRLQLLRLKDCNEFARCFTQHNRTTLQKLHPSYHYLLCCLYKVLFGIPITYLFN